mgnify:CR=1 FL=1
MMSSKLYWLLAILGLVIIGGGTALYMNKANKAAEPSAKTESVPAAESTTTESTDTTKPSTANGTAVKAGIESSAGTIGEIDDDIADIEEDTGSSNTDDEKPNF